MVPRTWARAPALLGAIVTAALLLSGHRASAFCGFYVGGAGAKLFNNATMVVLMRDGTKTVLSMQNNYQGPPDKFAMVVPVPVVLQKENVKTLPRGVFDRVDQLAAPRLVEYWEQDPCPQAFHGYGMGRGAGMASSKPAEDRGPVHAPEKPHVVVLAQFAVAEYEIVILGADDSLALDGWLRKEGYRIPDGAEPILRPYVQAGMRFFVAKVESAKIRFEQGQAMLSPLRFHYDAEMFSLPVRLGLVNSSGTQDLIVHVLARNQRFEVANYDNVAIPTNLDVNPGAKTNFASFYASLFDQTLDRRRGAVITEYAWAAQSCDPCPTPPLDASDLRLLGGDVTGQKDTNGFVLTRLHTRYRKDSIGADLVFKTAGPIDGGHEGSGNGVQKSGSNAFQGRYVLRHPWGGPITCKFPQRGNWGEPPPGVNVTPITPALKVAFAPRDPKLLPWLLAPSSAAVGLKGGELLSAAGALPAPTVIAAPLPAPAATAVATAEPAVETPAIPPPADPPNPVEAPGPPAAPPKGGCAGCAISEREGGGAALALGLGAMAWARRRRRPA